MHKLVEEHRRLVVRRAEIIAEQSALRLEMIEVDVKLDKLSKRIESALEEFRETGGVEHIDLEDTSKF